MSAEELSLIHIGLPKAASKALQKHFFPRLGLNYEPYYANDETIYWHKGIRFSASYVPRPRRERTVVSSENLCSPGKFGCDVVAQRLHATFGEAIVLIIVRDATEHFASIYRQMIANEIGRLLAKLKKANAHSLDAAIELSVPTIDEYFAMSARMEPNSYFHFMALDSNIAKFRERFRVLVVDWSLIVRSFTLFADVVCAELGLKTPSAHLPTENVSAPNIILAALDQIPTGILSVAVREQLLEYYAQPCLSPGNSLLLDNFMRSNCSVTFAEALRG